LPTSSATFGIGFKLKIMFLKGAGTAIGELPPYFMARASRLSGEIDEEERQLEELVKEKDQTSKMVQYCKWDNLLTVW
jgi:hypothetical protein